MFTSGNSATISRKARYIETAVSALGFEYPCALIKSAFTPSRLRARIRVFAAFKGTILFASLLNRRVQEAQCTMISSSPSAIEAPYALTDTECGLKELNRTAKAGD